MAENMMERVARAICEASGEYWREPPYNHLHTDKLNNHWRYKARAALEAMKKPTKVMVDAMDEHAGSIAPECAYEDAIAAALKENA